MCCMYSRTWALHIVCVNTNIRVVSMCVYEPCAWLAHPTRATWLQIIYLTYYYFTCVIWKLQNNSTTDEIVYECVMYMCTFIYADMCVRVCVYIYIHVYIWMYVCLQLRNILTGQRWISEYVYIYIYAHVYICIHTHAHTYQHI